MITTNNGPFGWLRTWLFVLGLTGIAALSGGPYELDAELAKGRAEGLLWENGLRPPVPDHENAMVALRPLLTPAVKAELVAFRPKLMRGGATYPQLAALRSEFIEASKRPRIVIKADFKKSFLDLSEPERNVSRIGRFLAADGRERLGKGDASGIDSFRAAARYCRLGYQEPSIVSHLVALAGEAIVLEELLRSLQEFQHSPHTISAAREVLNVLGPPLDLRPVMVGEYNIMRFLGEPPNDTVFPDSMPAELRLLFEEARKLAKETDSFGPDKILEWKVVSNRIVAETLRRHRELYHDLPNDPGDLEAVKRAITKATRPSVTSEALETLDMGDVITQSHIEALPEVLARRIARLNVLESLILVAERRLAGGPPPTTLPIGPRGGLDPFTGGALQYRVTGKKVTIWSLGPNKATDRATGLTTEGDDIVMSLQF